MRGRNSQEFWSPGDFTLRLKFAVHLAASEQERLWKGLERFVNCKDDPDSFQGLGLAFPAFWPVRIYYYPESEAHVGEQSVPESLTWHPACHRLFLCYRDTLREVWSGKGGIQRRALRAFLLGLTDWNRAACSEAGGVPTRYFGESFSGKLDSGWWHILRSVPTAYPVQTSLPMLWENGTICIDLRDLEIRRNDFAKACFSVFRKSWRARVCRRCGVRFVARKPKQLFCGTDCSAGSRLASKRKWWKRTGAARRADQQEERPKWNRRERRQR
jgi:hypothetical protein